MYGVDRKICHEGHWSASRGLPSDVEQWSRVTDFSFSCIPFDLPHLNLLWNYTFSFKGFLFNLKGVDATSDRRSVLYVNV